MLHIVQVKKKLVEMIKRTSHSNQKYKTEGQKHNTFYISAQLDNTKT